MKNKKIILLFLVLLIVIFVVGFFSIKYVKNKKESEIQNEYIPEEEISDEQLRETIVSLYFPDKETNSLKPEARLVNVKELMQSPYNVLIDLLIEGPKNDKLKSIIPENTKLINSSLEGECLILDFSSELLNYNKEDNKEKENLINAIINTVTELNEVNKVKILINGQTNEEFKDEYVRK
ncbi:MAG: GerMN domain-containing protein [Clostridia bacterium]|nr:GerMN domain-containing protein [Clostridia bacterium]